MGVAALLLASVLTLAAGAVQDAPTAPEPPVVMLIGVYHFDNPGRDIVNMAADDVTTPTRQTEILSLTDQFARFRPTVIAIEEVGNLPTLESQAFADYMAGRREGSRNERDQLGFRLAQRTGARVASVDVDMPLPFGPLMRTATAVAPEVMEQVKSTAQAQAEATSAALANGTVADALIYLNAPEVLRRNENLYYLTLAVSDDGGATLPGVEVASVWYERNLRVCARLLSVAKPGERVIVFYGSGHIPQLGQCLSNAGVRLEDPLPYLSAAR
jgi:hypothetical protein